MIELLHMDCMNYMATLPDKAFDLAIVDPPYGINYAEIAGKRSGKQYGNAAAASQIYAPKKWDKSIPNKNYFDQLKRVSSKRIIWGGNYMTPFLEPSMGWIVWDKDNGDNGFSDCELAFTDFEKGLRKFKYTWNGMIQGNMAKKELRIHPTQKPVKLYEWILTNYAKPGQRILDTHLGSGSSAIAAHNLGFEFVGMELDKDYYEAASARLKQHQAQQTLFAPHDVLVNAVPEQIDIMAGNT